MQFIKINRNKFKNFVFAVMLSCGVLGFSMAMGGIYYYQPDDYLMNYISSGAFGNGPDAYLVFINLFLGKISAFFYRLIPGINWFGIMYIITVAFSFFSLFYLFLELNKSYFPLIIIATLEFGTMVLLTFTVLAYISMGVFWVYMIYMIICKKKENVELEKCIFALIALVMGIGFRTGNNVLISSAAVFFPIFLFELLNIKVKSVRWFVIIAVFICVLMPQYNTRAYRQDDFWNTYRQYNIARSAVLDSKEINYEQSKIQLEEVGISQNDLNCLKNWIFADRDTYSLDNLRSLANIQSNKERNEYDPIKLIKKMLNEEYNYIFTIFAIFFFVLAKSTKKKITIGAIAITTLLLIVMLYVKNRPVERVMMPIYFLGIIGMMFYLYKDNQIMDNKTITRSILKLIISALIIGFMFFFRDRAYINRQQNQNVLKKHQKSMEYMQDNKEILFVGSYSTLNPILGASTIFAVDKNIQVDNILKLGTWDIYSTRYYSQVIRYDLSKKDNALISMAIDDNIVYIVDDNSLPQKDMIMKYIKEHTGKQVVADLIQRYEEEKISFYRLRTAN